MTEDPTQKTPEQIAHDIVQGAIKKRDAGHLARLRRHFFAGLLVLTPLVLTIWIVGWLINLIDGNTRDFLGNVLQRLGLEYQVTVFGRKYEVIPIGFGLLLLFLLTCFVGMVASNLLGRRILNLLDRIIRKVPGVSWVYKATHQVSHALLSRNKDLFQEVIFIEYPRKGLYSFAFVTNMTVPGVKMENGQELRTVFLPTTPNPTSGFLLLVPEAECIPCPMSVEEAMKMVISGGVVLPETSITDVTYLALSDESRTLNA